jgi:hypothetical protein
MSEAPQKRILPPRERRESANKRRELTPPIKPSPSPTLKKKTLPTKVTSELRNSRGKEYVRGPYNTKKKELVVVRDASTPGVEEVLRTKVIESGPIPTTRTQQPDKLSSKEYQSIAESAVLASALHRSRMRWLCDGIFEKYWTKPVKKKGAPEVPPNNPDPKSMTKMQGTVTVTIEPHVFDAVFYTVREIPPAPAPQPKHANQHMKAAPPSTGYYPTPGWGPLPSPAQSAGPSPHQSVPDRTITPASRPSSAAGPGQGQPHPVQSPSTNMKDIKMKGGAVHVQHVMHTKDIKLRGGAPDPSTPAADPAKPNTDPVIQMLASRAATDPHLKELMKQVATSKASPSQLKEFQSHIDEFNALIKRQEAEGKRPGPIRPPTKSSTSASKPAPPAASHPAMYSTPTPPAGRGTPIYSTAPPHAHTGYPPYPPPPASRPTPRPEPAITAIVFEFVTPPSYNSPASQDRWLFPAHAVLDTPHSGRGLEMIVSWFVERTGLQIKTSLGITPQDEMGSQKWKDEVTYFQPVTMKLNSAVHKPLMTIAVNARSLVEVQRYMEGVMESKVRVKEEWLALRLPRPGVEAVSEGEGEKFRDSGVEVEEEDELKDFYGCP